VHREVQRILMELLNQMDGFDQNVNVKVPHAAPYAIHAIESRLQKKSYALLVGM
jgi:ATP-dependent 26S proteasome regulatory subunit